MLFSVFLVKEVLSVKIIETIKFDKEVPFIASKYSFLKITCNLYCYLSFALYLSYYY